MPQRTKIRLIVKRPATRGYPMNAPAVSNVTAIDTLTRSFSQMTTFHDKKHEVSWCYMHAQPRPAFVPQLLEELNSWCGALRQTAEAAGVKYHVIASRVPHVFNLGGDLELFSKLVGQQERESLLAYGIACIDALYANLSHFGCDLTTVSLIQGTALGGGFETALSSDVIIAERGSRMGFPEILFNLFPGMGAYSLLSRRLTPRQAEQLILSGKVYDAEELHSMGLIDILAEAGEGEMAVYDYIKRENRARNGFRAVRRVRDQINPITYQELLDVVTLWVDTAMKLERRDLRMMERLVARQGGLQADAA